MWVKKSRVFLVRINEIGEASKVIDAVVGR
jgi:hypothetical protein